jgi:primosomal protein N' (replication factor Y) (superfamily II helicase)
LKFAEIILPIPLKGTFTYSLPAHIAPIPLPGCRVIVQFGKRKIYTGIIHHLHDLSPTEYEPKEILDVIDDTPVITPIQIAFFEWIAKYYMCTIGEVMKAALPSGLKISSESYITVNPEIEISDLDLTEKEQLIINNLQSNDLTLDELAKLLDIKSAHNHVKNLSQKKAILLFEQIKDKYTPKTERRIRLKSEHASSTGVQNLFDTLEKKQKQSDVLLSYLRLSNVMENFANNQRGTSRKALLDDDNGESSLKTLIKNGVLEEWNEIISRIPFESTSAFNVPKLSAEQLRAKDEILSHFQQIDTVLLKGITGSGKTEVYISLIEDVIKNEGRALYLLPEIALTTQIIKRLRIAFGNNFGVYHSKYSENERVEVWQKVLSGEYKFVVGVRSAIFLPFPELSLIIIDEEHESSYKQYEPAPRYHARDAALYLASVFHAKTLLGTATPAIESYKNALDGKYGLVRMDKRFGDVQLPEIVFADMSSEKKKKTLKGNFSSQLLDEIAKTLEDNNQVILFQNRRGYAPFLQCDQCGYSAKCPNCDVSLTYHIYQNVLACHYCGHKKSMITECPQCSSHELKTMSFGTEKLEEELEILIPTARIQRMDLDSTRNKNSHQHIINDFEAGSVDILVGTQMVTKGLDFDRVLLVGVFSADRMINFPDFRAHERAFQLIHQVSGRSGRRKDKGKVIIQTSDPTQPLLNWIKNNDYESFYQNEIDERDRFHYPPFYRMIVITLKCLEKQVVADAAQSMYNHLASQLGQTQVIGPVEPLVSRVRNLFIMEITVKIQKQSINLSSLKDFLLTSRTNLLSQRSYQKVKVSYDVDPV